MAMPTLARLSEGESFTPSPVYNEVLALAGNGGVLNG